MTPKELALAIGASESSVRRWIDAGSVGLTRTAGGHRRIPLAEALRFIRQSRAPVVRPDLLGMPEVTAPAARGAGGIDQAAGAAGGAERASEGGAEAIEAGGVIVPAGVVSPPGPSADEIEEALFRALASGDSAYTQGLMLSWYLAGHSLAALFDGPVRRAFDRLGQLWQCAGREGAGILTEHLAIDLCLSALNRLRSALPPPPPGAPLALGGAPNGDPYLLPTVMCATVLADAGYQSINFGPQTPVALLGEAAAGRRAALVWLSISPPLEQMPGGASLAYPLLALARQLRASGASLVVGGKHAADHQPRGREASGLPIHFGETMGELAAFARGLAGTP